MRWAKMASIVFKLRFTFLIEEEFSMSTYEINKILENVKKFISGPSRG